MSFETKGEQNFDYQLDSDSYDEEEQPKKKKK